MGVAVRKFPHGYKSLLHFDYPYFAEPGDGMREEIGVLEWNIFQMTHNHLPERFIINRGGGVIILSEGTVTAGDSARIGASWSGSGKGGAGAYRANGNPGGSGYGGSGRTSAYSNYNSGIGGVGGGGGGMSIGSGDASQFQPGNAGSHGQTGGRTCNWRGTYADGGTQGTETFAVSSLGDARGSYGGGGALGTSLYPTAGGTLMGYSGASVMIICKKLKVSMDAISTGGSGGIWYSGHQNSFGCGGGGCGMCYLAYEETE